MNESEAPETDKLGWLRATWQAGVAGGEAGPLDFAALKMEARARLHQSETPAADLKSKNLAD